MLDDLGLLHQRDKSDALGIAGKEWQQLAWQPELAKQSAKITNIVFCGMGGSALAARVAQSWPNQSVPMALCGSYSLPDYVSAETLVIVSSYSGNTEETLSALTQAEQKGATIAVMAATGQLEEIALKAGYPFVKLPPASQPRYAMYYSLVGLVNILIAFDLATAEAKKELTLASEFLKTESLNWLADVPTDKNLAKQLALELLGKSVVIYAGSLLFPAAYKWKISVNENAKNIAWCNVMPEFHHNEFIGWSSHPHDKPYAIVFLESSLEHPQIIKRFGLTERLLSGRWPAPHRITVQGATILQQIVWASTFGEFVSLYLGVLNNVDLLSVELVERFKKELAS